MRLHALVALSALLLTLPVSAASINLPPFAVTDVAPKQGPSDQEVLLVVRGQSFNNDDTIFLDETVELERASGPWTTGYTPDTTVVTLPAGLTEGPHSITVDSARWGQRLTLTDAYIVGPPGITPGPGIADVFVNRTNPATEDSNKTYDIVVNGVYFQDGATLELSTFDGAAYLFDATFVDANTLTATTPEELPDGTYSVRVTNPDQQYDVFSATLLLGPYGGSSEDCQCAIRASNPTPHNRTWTLAALLVSGFLVMRRRRS